MSDTASTSKTSFFINPKGKFFTKVTELYLRQNVPTGWADCELDEETKDILKLADDDASRWLFFFDGDTLASQLDLVENCQKLHNIVVLQSSIERIREKQAKVYVKLRHMVELDANKFVYVFPDDYCSATQSASRNESEKLVKTVQYYKSKITQKWVRMLVISNSFEVASKAKDASIDCVTVQEFANRFLSDSPHLADFIGMGQTASTAVDDLAGVKETSFLYSEHLPAAAVDAGVKTGDLLRGKYKVNRNNPNEGVVSTALGFDVKVVGKAGNNRAILGDVVAVRLLDESKWLATKTVDMQDDDQDTPENRTSASTIDEKKYGSLRERIIKENLCPVAEVVGIIKRDLRNLAGQITSKLLDVAGKSYVLVNPVDPRYPSTVIAVSSFDALAKKKISFSIDHWHEQQAYPLGHLVGIFGDADDLNTESKVILFEHNVETRTFSQAVLDCLPKEGANFKISEEELKKRQDLREYPICSVDPPGCKDIDDALHSRMLSNGNIEVGVHIADVSHFVRPDTPIDKEAAFRSTTVYLVDRRTDMLPGLLTENLCSLRSDVERLAFSVVWEMNPKTAEIIHTKYHKSVIKSKRAFTYKEAQELIDDKSVNTSVSQSLRGLMKMAKLLKQGRLEKGALQLASTQVKFKFEEETHNPTDVTFYDLLDTNSMVEEFMLLANVAVAAKNLEHFPGKSILRHHSTPKPQMIKEFSTLLQNLGYNLDYSSSRALADSLDKIVRPGDTFFNKLVRIMATRCMNEATYICTADFDYPEYFHYGLAAEVYTHFTSPIRRYADILVHRLLAASLDIDSLPQSMCNKHTLAKICDNMNARHRNARFASRASSDYYSFLFFKDKSLKESAIVSGIELNGVAVMLPKYGFEGFAEFSDADAEANRKLNEQRGSKIVTSCVLNGQEYQIFDRVDVLLSMQMRHFRKQIIIKIEGKGKPE